VAYSNDGRGFWMAGVVGISLMARALWIFLFTFKKKDEDQKQTV
jgi:hypothetical protein